MDAMSKAARDQAAAVIRRTTVFDESAEAAIPRFKTSEIVPGRVVARGGFSVIQEVSSFKIPELKKSGGYGFKKRGKKQRSPSSRVTSNGSQESNPIPSTISGDNTSEAPSSFIHGDTMSREVLARKAARRGKIQFVIKSLPPSNYSGFREHYVKGMVDLALEAKFLANLSHPHIIPLRGMSQVGGFDCNNRFFLIIDRLPQLLMDKMKDWSNTDRASRGITGALTGGKARKRELLVERLQVAHDMASAMEYLHGRDLVYRDLKPDNVGFSTRGKVTLFDFGLCRQICEEDRVRDKDCKKGDETYHMTGCTGSIRYMAPEVGLCRPYGKKVDVYSYGMLLWFMMALEPPFSCYTPDMLPKRVFEKGHRPFLMTEWSSELATLFKSCWDAAPRNRPSFRRIKNRLRDQIRFIAPDVALIMKQGEEGSGSISLDVSS